MKWMLRYAVLLAALVIALGSVAAIRPEVAAANDDVIFLQPPGGERGDPDIGGGGYNFGTSCSTWIGAAKRHIHAAWNARRSLLGGKPTSASPSRAQLWSRRR